MDLLNDCLKNMFLLFHEFFDFLQQNAWCEHIIGTDVADIFFKAKNIESFCAIMNSIGSAEVFDDKLKDFWLVMGKENGPQLDYFKHASDLALEKYLVYEKFDNFTVKLSIDLYLEKNSKEKFISVIKDLVETHQMCSILSGIVIKNVNIVEVESRIIFENWKSILSLNSESYSVIHDSVGKLINDDVNNVKLLFKILCFQNKSKHSLIVKDIVFANIVVVLENSFDKKLWALVINIEDDDFKDLLKNYRELLKPIFNIIEFSAQKLKIVYSSNNYEWIEDQCYTSLSYSDCLVLLKKVKCIGGDIEKDLDGYLLRMKSSGLCVFFEDIIRDIGSQHRCDFT